MYLVRTPEPLKPLFRDLVWSVKEPGRRVFLTFDDGPIPEVTPWVLDALAVHGAKATFFCIGRNVAKEPALFQRLQSEGHAVGNHTHDHLNGWQSSQRAYLRNVLRCQALTGTTLFRPPYGRITAGQSRALKERFHIVMWDVLSADFDERIDGERCYRNVVDHVAPGSIIVFHDSLKAAPRLRYALPRVLERLTQEGYSMEALDAEELTRSSR